MQKYLTVDEMLAVENAADQAGLSYAEMIQNAGKSIAEFIINTFKDLENKFVFAIVGSGNNGADTLVAVQHLVSAGWQASVMLLNKNNAQDSFLKKLSPTVKVFEFSHSDPTELKEAAQKAGILLDGVLGTGAQLPLRQHVKQLLVDIKLVLEDVRGIKIIAVDCPTGIDCRTGEAAEETIKADYTVCMAAIKSGLLSSSAQKYLGELSFASIGNLEKLTEWTSIQRYILDSTYISSLFPVRQADGHKGTFGSALILAGSKCYPGAALLAGKAAFRSGVGLVEMAVGESVYHLISGQFPEAIWQPLPETEGAISENAFDQLRKKISERESLLIGPGFGTFASSKSLIERLISKALPSTVFDADALNILAEIPNWPNKIPPYSILTPHLGEMAKLANVPIAEVQSKRIEVAEYFAKQWQVVLVLKGAFTIIATPKGETYINPFATSALACAGSGDVLAGLITGFLAQGVNPTGAASLGAWVHARAGIASEMQFGNPAGVLAGDLIREIPYLLK